MKIENLKKEPLTEAGITIPDYTSKDFNTFHTISFEKFKKMQQYLYKCGLLDDGRIYETVEDFLTDVKQRFAYMGESLEHVKINRLAPVGKKSNLTLADSSGKFYDNIDVIFIYTVEDKEVIGQVSMNMLFRE